MKGIRFKDLDIEMAATIKESLIVQKNFNLIELSMRSTCSILEQVFARGKKMNQYNPDVINPV